MPNYFKIKKAAQVSAFFAITAGGSINVLKLVKLIYLSDRRFMEKYDSTILNDRFVSMQHGPVNSLTLDYIKGCAEDRENWATFVSDRAGHFLGLARQDITVDSLDELSDAEIEVLSDIWDEFGPMSQYEISDYTHQNCLEWEDPKGSSYPIPYERVFKFLGKPDSALLAQKLEDDISLDQLFATA